MNNCTHLPFESAWIRAFNLDIAFQYNIIHSVSAKSRFCSRVIYNFSLTIKSIFTTFVTGYMLSQENDNFYSYIW